MQFKFTAIVIMKTIAANIIRMKVLCYFNGYKMGRDEYTALFLCFSPTGLLLSSLFIWPTVAFVSANGPQSGPLCWRQLAGPDLWVLCKLFSLLQPNVCAFQRLCFVLREGVLQLWDVAVLGGTRLSRWASLSSRGQLGVWSCFKSTERLVQRSFLT